MTAEAYENLRKRLLTRRSADLGLRRIPGRPVWGVVMEMREKDTVATIVATDDGAVSLLTSDGDAVHLAKDDWPSSAGSRLIGSAGDFLFECSPAWAYPLAEHGMVRFYLLTFDGVMTTEAPMRELASDQRPLSNLYYAGHDVQFLVQFIKKDPNWRAHKPVVGHVPAPPTVQAEVPAKAKAEVPAAAPAAGSGGLPAGAAAPTRSDLPSAAAPAAPAETLDSELLVRAAAGNDVDEVAILLAKGHDAGPNEVGITPLMAAAHAGALEPLRLLLAARVPVDVQDSHGYTALMLACNAGRDVCVRLLLGAGADVEVRDDEGFTAIMFAAKNGHNDIVRMLMDRGADPAATSERGLSAASLATQKGHTQTVALLLGES